MPPTFPDPRTLPPCLLPHLRTFAVGDCTFDTLPLGRGEYERGDKNGYPDEQPIRTVHIDYDVELGRYPVTQALWQAVMGKNPAHFPGDERPVETVSWDDIRQPDGFLDRLNAHCRTADGQPLPGRFRLPTEAEWVFVQGDNAVNPVPVASGRFRLQNVVVPSDEIIQIGVTFADGTSDAAQVNVANLAISQGVVIDAHTLMFTYTPAQPRTGRSAQPIIQNNPTIIIDNSRNQKNVGNGDPNME